MDIEPLERRAGLAAVQEGAPENPLGDRLRIGVGQDDAGVVAPQLQRDALQRGGGGSHHLAPGGGRSGKDDLGDIGMTREPGPDLIAAGDGVEHAARQRPLQDLDQAQSSEGGEGRGLDHHRISSADRGHDVPDGDHQRPVPRRDRHDHAHRLAVKRDVSVFVVLDHLDRQVQARGMVRPGRRATHFIVCAETAQGLALFAAE